MTISRFTNGSVAGVRREERAASWLGEYCFPLGADKIEVRIG
ncbi:hypothetical protein ACIA5D_43550 [Actinoplanes sp. NPDC051513]